MSNPCAESHVEQTAGRYRLILRYVLPYKTKWVKIIAITLISSVFTLLQPWPMKVLVDNVLGGQQPPAYLSALPRAMFSGVSGGFCAGLATLLLYILGAVLDVFLTSAWVRTGQKMVYDLAEDLLARIQRRSLIFHAHNSVGDLMGRIMEDSWCVYKLVDMLLFTPGHAAILMAGMTVILWRMNPSLTIVALIAAAFMTAATLAFGMPMRAVSRAQRETESQIQSHVQRILSGIPLVQLFVQEEREHRRFVEFSNAIIAARRRSTLIGSAASLASGLASALGSAAILWMGASQVIAGRLTLGGLMIYLGYLGTLQAQFKAFAETYKALQTTGASIDRAAEILQVEPEIQDRSGALVLPAPARGHVRIENVAFGYEQGRPVLSNVSLEAAPGETVAIVGQTGAGKSTLLALVLRLFDPWQGRVAIDGHDLRDLSISSVRGSVGIVLQEPLLFPISIADNIAFGRPDATRGQIIAAAKAANAHEFVMQLPAGYDTIIGERGATLSGGERQRISIARALLKDAPILILDEPTSGLDAATEREVLDALTQLMQGRTVLVIAHRLSTVRRADKIIALDRGRVMEQGSHDQLLASGGVYAQLQAIQQGVAV